MMSEQFLNDIFDSICEVQSKNPPNEFGSYGNFLNTTIDWGIREHFKQNGFEEVKDSLVDKITDEVKYQYF
jgi:hypothetical protein